jgi:hypothetical protein
LKFHIFQLTTIVFALHVLFLGLYSMGFKFPCFFPYHYLSYLCHYLRFSLNFSISKITTYIKFLWVVTQLIICLSYVCLLNTDLFLSEIKKTQLCCLFPSMVSLHVDDNTLVTHFSSATNYSPKKQSYVYIVMWF